ncbi:hypothetical protein Agub_g3057, partial [Astrephomene gubernaculifera]
RLSSGVCRREASGLDRRSCSVVASAKVPSSARQGGLGDIAVKSRRSTLLLTLVGSELLLRQAVMPSPASADVLKDALRGFTRPDVSVQDAVVILMDARSTLREIQGIAATPPDSGERFRARAFWPAYAKRLRAVAEAAPVVAGVVTGAGDSEETLGAMYGGKAQGAGVADTVYAGLGRVLTISGRTIRPEAQAGPEAAAGAEAAIEGLLLRVPAPLLEAAEQFRVERARAAGQR